MRISQLVTAPAASGPPSRTAIDRRLNAASLLCLASLSELRAAWLDGPTDEMSRRRLELQVRSLVHVVRELAVRIIDLRSSAVPAGACGICGWSRPAHASGLCPRCEEIREAAPLPDVSQLLAEATRPRRVTDRRA